MNENARFDSPSLALLVDGICDDFEKAWQTNPRPDLAEFLLRVDASRRLVLLRNLIGVDSFYRRQLGEDPTLEDYLDFCEGEADRISDLFESGSTTRSEHGSESPDSTLDEANWFYARNNEKFGPFNWQEMRRFANAGKLQHDDHVWSEGAAKWVLASSVEGLCADYQIIEELARGNMGVVYKALQVSLDRVVALKRILPGRKLRQSFQDRFEREAAAVARLNHSNIVHVHEFGEHQGQPFISFEFVDGPSLAGVTKHEPRSAMESAALVEILARAMDHAHRNGVLHRDLKPANILMEGIAERQAPLSSWVPKIGDFGLAKLVDDESERTQAGAIMGTPSYMAPEQARGDLDSIGPTTDIYGLGAILYEMLTGGPPFRTQSVAETLELVRTKEPLAPSQLIPGCPKDLEAICLKCLEKEPPRRYSSGAELADDLRAFQEQRPIRARPVGRIGKGWRWCRRNPVVASLLVLVGVLLLAGTGVSTYFALEERARADEADEKTKLAEDNAKLARDQTRRTQQELARFALERGRVYLAKPEDGTALPWLIRSLDIAIRAKDADLERVIRRNLGAAWMRTATLRSAITHNHKVLSSAISPDGTTALLGFDFDKEEKGVGRLFDIRTGSPLEATLHHLDRLLNVRFGPRGRLAVSKSLDGVRAWDVTTGEELGLRLRAGHSFAPIGFGNEGRSALIFSSWGAVQRWDIPTRQPTGPTVVHDKQVTSASYSPDMKWIATGSEDRTVRVWDARTGQKIAGPLTHPDTVSAVVFGPKGKRLATACWDGTVRIWSTVTWRLEGKPWPHPAGVVSVEFSPNGRTVVTTDETGVVRFWDPTNGTSSGLPLAHSDRVTSVALSPTEPLLVVNGSSGESRIWDLPPLLPRRCTFTHDGRVSTVGFGAEGTKFFAASGRGVYVFDSRTATLESEVKCRGGSVRAVLLLDEPSCLQVLVGNNLEHRDPKTGELIRPNLVSPERSYGRTLAPNGKLVAFANGDVVRLWHLDENRVSDARLTHPKQINALRFSPDSEVLATSTVDPETGKGLLFLWNVHSGKQRARWQAHSAPINALAFSADGSLLLTGSDDGSARLWKTATRTQVGDHFPHPDKVVVVAFSPDGSMILTGCADQKVRLWDVGTAQPLGSPWAHTGSVTSVAFSPDSTLALTGSSNGDAQLWAIPPRLNGSVEELRTWSRAFTGVNLDQSNLETVMKGEQLRQYRSKVDLDTVSQRVRPHRLPALPTDLEPEVDVSRLPPFPRDLPPPIRPIDLPRDPLRAWLTVNGLDPKNQKLTDALKAYDQARKDKKNFELLLGSLVAPFREPYALYWFGETFVPVGLDSSIESRWKLPAGALGFAAYNQLMTDKPVSPHSVELSYLAIDDSHSLVRDRPISGKVRLRRLAELPETALLRLQYRLPTGNVCQFFRPKELPQTEGSVSFEFAPLTEFSKLPAQLVPITMFVDLCEVHVESSKREAVVLSNKLAFVVSPQ